MLRRLALLTGSLALGVSGLHAQRPAAPPAPAPAPGAPAIYKSSRELLDALASAAPTGDLTESAVLNTGQYRANLIRRDKGAGAITHAGNTELHYITGGAATVVTGGTLVRAAGGPSTIANGVSRRVIPGDVLIFPPDTPHWYKEVEGSVTYLEVRFPTPAP